MHDLTKRQAMIAETRLAEALGRPIKRCPACNEIGSHFVPEGLDADDTVIPGRFTCQPEPDPDPTALALDFGDLS
jgi:hypothetical protein